MGKTKHELKTKNGYDFYAVTSAMQKAIRRGDAKVAGICALELWPTYANYIWKRLYTISAEDCWGVITKEIEALHRAYEFVNKGSKDPKGRIFISKAVILLSMAKKSRDADHLQNLVYDKIGMKDPDVQKYIEECENEPLEIPEYAWDVHTRKGRAMGKTKRDFFIEEYEALQPRQLGLFDDYVEEL